MLDLFIRWPQKRFNSKRNLVDIHNYKENEKKQKKMSIRICDEMLYVSFALFMGNSKAFQNERMNIDRVSERVGEWKETWKMSVVSISAGKSNILCITIERIVSLENKRTKHKYITYFVCVSGSFNSTSSTHFTIWKIFLKLFILRIFFIVIPTTNKKQFLVDVDVEVLI